MVGRIVPAGTVLGREVTRRPYIMAAIHMTYPPERFTRMSPGLYEIGKFWRAIEMDVLNLPTMAIETLTNFPRADGD